MISKILQLLLFGVVVGFAPRADAANGGAYRPSPTLKAPKCSKPWSTFDAYSKQKDPYQICLANPSPEDQNCFESARSVQASKPIWIALRREQLKLIISQEVSYASRFKALSHDGIDHWQVLRERWRQRLLSDPEVLALDADVKLDRDRCALSMVLGFDCATQPGFDILGVHQARANSAEKNRDQVRVLPKGIVYDLLSASVLLETLAPSDIRNAPHLDAVKEATDSVLSFLPELAMSPSLRMRVKMVARRQGLIAAAQKLDTRSLDMQQRLEEIDRLLISQMTKPLSQPQVQMIEEEFFKANGLLLATLESQILRGRKDPGVIFDQDYLLYSLGRHEHGRKNLNLAGILQAAVCGNEIAAKRSSQRLEMAKLGFAALGLLTGVGAMFDVGAILSVTFLTTMSASMVTTSALDLYQTGSAAAQQRDLFALKVVPYSDWKEAEDRFGDAIPWAVVNVAAVAPIFAIAKIQTSLRAARLAGDLERVRKLDRYHKATVAIAISMGVGLTAIQISPAVDAAKDFLGENKKTQVSPGS